jgi:uncharacterized protein
MTLIVQITPNAPRSEIVGWLGEKLKIKIKAPPVDGKANAELVRFLAEKFSVKQNTIRIVRGETSKTKIIELSGVDEAVLRELMKPE